MLFRSLAWFRSITSQSFSDVPRNVPFMMSFAVSHHTRRASKAARKIDGSLDVATRGPFARRRDKACGDERRVKYTDHVEL